MTPQDLADPVTAPELPLAADDERLMRTHVENRDHDAAAQRVAATDLGYAINGPSARPQPKDSATARQTAKVELDPSAHLGVRVLDAARVAGDPGNEESGHARLQSEGASVLALFDSRLGRPKSIRPTTDARRLSRLTSRCPAANLADPRD
jgi:hypothetical protein